MPVRTPLRFGGRIEGGPIIPPPESVVIPFNGREFGWLMPAKVMGGGDQEAGPTLTTLLPDTEEAWQRDPFARHQNPNPLCREISTFGACSSGAPGVPLLAGHISPRLLWGVRGNGSDGSCGSRPIPILSRSLVDRKSVV